MTSVFNMNQIPHHHHHNSFQNFHHHAAAPMAHAYVPAQQQPQSPVAGIHIPLQDERHILAERFKTKVCRNYVTMGMCPYESRCMFAHGDAEMRTAEMNIRDGLFTEEAIKAFKRAHRMMERAEAVSKLPPPPAYTAAPAPAYNALPQQKSSPSPLENESFEQSFYPDTPVSQAFEEEYVEENFEDYEDCDSLAGTALVEEHHYDYHANNAYLNNAVNAAPQGSDSHSGSFNVTTSRAPVYRHNPYSLATPFEVMPVKTVGGIMNAHVMP